MRIILNELNERIHQSKKLVEALMSSQNTVVCSTKFGPDSLVFLHLVTRISPSMPIIWVDTGYNNRDTLAFMHEATCNLKLNLRTFEPVDHVIQIPPSIDDPSHQEFTDIVKLKPLRGALQSLDASHWVSSIRSYQTCNRKSLPTMLQLSNQLTKVHPMLDWSEANIMAYLEHYKLPVGPDAYDPTKGTALRECGLHEIRTFFS